MIKHRNKKPLEIIKPSTPTQSNKYISRMSLLQHEAAFSQSGGKNKNQTHPKTTTPNKITPPQTYKCISEVSTLKRKISNKANRAEMYIPGWFLVFVLAPLSFHFFIRVPWPRCCNCFVKSHVKHQQFLQHLPLLKSYILHLWQREWMELRKNHDLRTAFLF